MGTRHLTMVVYNNEYVVAQYGQWDGYPDGEGQYLLEFLNLIFDREKFIKKLSNIRMMSWLERESLYKNTETDFKSKYPTLCSYMASEVLELIQNSTGEIPLANSLDFAASSTWCEWAYVIDLDKDTFEVYKGCNQRKLGKNQRFFFLQKEDDEYFFPVRLKSRCSLSEIPKDNNIKRMRGLKNAA